MDNKQETFSHNILIKNINEHKVISYILLYFNTEKYYFIKNNFGLILYPFILFLLL